MIFIVEIPIFFIVLLVLAILGIEVGGILRIFCILFLVTSIIMLPVSIYIFKEMIQTNDELSEKIGWFVNILFSAVGIFFNLKWLIALWGKSILAYDFLGMIF